MAIVYTKQSGEFHLYNKDISYVIKILDNNQLGNLYYGKRIDHKESFSYLLEGGMRALAVYTKEGDYYMSPQYTKMEYPCAGTGDFREPAFEIRQENGSRIVYFEYNFHKIYKGKPKLEGLPAVYVESENEADTLELILRDKLTGIECILSYTIYLTYPVITRSVRFVNGGQEKIFLERVLSASVDLPDSEYEMIHLSGAWARERHVKERKLEQGIQGIGSRRGASSAEHNPFIALKRPNTDEHNGEVFGFSLIYSGNHMEQVEVDTCNMTRVQLGIHPEGFSWMLLPQEHFQSPEAVFVYSDQGLGGMSRTFHQLYRKRLVRGCWRDRVRPLLINNWEATGPDFTEKSILAIAGTAEELGIELFVLDDGWFGERNDDKAGLGDWYVSNHAKLPGGIAGLAKKINEIGMEFGLWFEPEMVNRNSDLFRKNPDWILCVPGREPSPSRNQYVLDFSREEVVEYVYCLMEDILRSAAVSYVKWDMNRYITDCYSAAKEPDEQGKVPHQYILGLYKLLERLITEFPAVLFESCSSGGARFDPGMLYYTPQIWTSDNTDAMERIKIQYGTSYVYPLSSMGAHVSEVPNQQTGRMTPLQTRANVAVFGTFGYELDLNQLTVQERQMVKEQIEFVKEHRELIQSGDFYRLQNPFEGNVCAWMVVGECGCEALVGCYIMTGVPNGPWMRLHLQGLTPGGRYAINGRGDELFGGDELMNAGMVIRLSDMCMHQGDYVSAVYHLKKIR
ncbi:MAG: alpha-galactosidase [Lachnospiraceae bacterium]